VIGFSAIFELPQCQRDHLARGADMTIHDSPADIAHEIFERTSLLAVLLAQPDADSAIDGMHRVAIIIRERAGVLRENLDPKAE
jgi:hypothetical protein